MIEPFIIKRGAIPIIAHKRDERREIVMTLATEDLYWCQYVDQFAYEFANILCGYCGGDCCTQMV